MKSEHLLLWAVRISWPVLGGVWGAVTGFAGYRGITTNADSFGSLFAQGFFITTAVIGLVAGITCGLCVGGLTEKLLGRLGIRTASALGAATIVNALVIWQLAGIVQTRYPAYSPSAVKPRAGALSEEALTHKQRPENPCAQPPPPVNTKERAGWDAECR